MELIDEASDIIVALSSSKSDSSIESIESVEIEYNREAPAEDIGETRTECLTIAVFDLGGNSGPSSSALLVPLYLPHRLISVDDMFPMGSSMDLGTVCMPPRDRFLKYH